jgi:phosphatidylglycerol:prolipoprotein diacylglycerol transferase
MEKRGRGFPGRTFWGYMFLYAVSRFIIEFYRGDPRGTVFGVLSTSQFISVVLGPMALVMLVWLSRLTPTAPQAQKTRCRVAA